MVEGWGLGQKLLRWSEGDLATQAELGPQESGFSCKKLLALIHEVTNHSREQWVSNCTAWTSSIYTLKNCKILGFYPRPTELETLGVIPQSVLTSSSGDADVDKV